MRDTWTPRLAPGDDRPLFVRLVDGVVEDVRTGRLARGARLPGSRSLARVLGVNRGTVVQALDELVAQGLLVSRPASGTFVADGLPTTRPSASSSRRTLPSALPPLPSLFTDFRRFEPASRSTFALSAGSPDARLFPVEALARAWRGVARRQGRALFAYGHPAGVPALRQALARSVADRRAIAATADDVLVTRGAQMALTLCARALLRPGDVVAVEALGYRPAWDALKLSGASLASVPVDEDGLDVGALERLCQRTRVRAVYVTPHHQFPTTATLSAPRRAQLLSLSRRAGFVLLEDDFDHEHHYDGRPVLPLASAPGAGHVVYVGTLSKVLAPGLRLGFVVGPPELLERLVTLRALLDRQGDHPMEAAVAEFMEDGELDRHLRRTRLALRARRDALLAALTRYLPNAVSAQRPRGGIALWAQVAPDVPLVRWRERCAAEGVLLTPGSHFTFDRSEPRCLRLVFAQYDEGELERAVQRMARALPSGQRRSAR